MDEEEDKTPQATHRLSEIETETIGLVQRGANNSTFFLLKSQEAPMPDDELEIEEVVEETPLLDDQDPPPETSPPEEVTPVDDTFFEKMRGQFEKWGILKARASKDAIANAAKMLGVDPRKMAKLYGQMMDGDEEEDEMEMGKKPASQSKPGKRSTRKDSEETAMNQDDIQKAIEAAYEAKTEAIVKTVKAELEKVYQDKVTTLETQVAELSKSEQEQRDKREEREFLEKAMVFKCFPTTTSDLGSMLRQLSKSVDKESYEKWEALLKAADAQLFTAGLFGEIGTAQTAEEVLLVEKVQKDAKEKGFEAAVLSLSNEDQARLLAESRARAGGK